jgi:alkylated DNA nucleotide flippase Atl1/catechol 2,3-dioxygenase-like lactoylglutathione lyase family enzyme
VTPGSPQRLPEHADRVLEIARSIPAGRVLTYGDIARLVGVGGPRQVGTVLARYGSDAPWWRVLRAGGLPPQGHEDRALEHYLDEGTPLVGPPRQGYRVDLRRGRWRPEPGQLPGPAAVTGAAYERGVAGSVHHVEVWVEDLAAARREWGWLLGWLGYRLGDDWGTGLAWEHGAFYLVVEAGPDVVPGRHERRRAGVNHLAFHAGSRESVDALVAQASGHGWRLLFEDRHPYAGGPDHYAAYLESGSGFEVELVAADPVSG